MLEQSTSLPNVDLLPAYESNDRKALNNPIEAHIIAEVKITSQFSSLPRNFTVLFRNECKRNSLLLIVFNMFLTYLFFK